MYAGSADGAYGRAFRMLTTSSAPSSTAVSTRFQSPKKCSARRADDFADVAPGNALLAGASNGVL
jgi:hypothetical protein